MAMPKSVTKIDKNGITYISNVNAAEYTIQELSKAALRDVAKLLRYEAKKAAPKDRGDYQKNIATWVRINKQTGQPELHFGIYSKATAKKKGIPYVGFYAHIIEFGSKTVTALKILSGTTYSNINNIIQITSKYLSAIEDPHKTQAYIEEGEEITEK